MIVSYSQIVGSQVLAINEQRTVGKIADLVLQKSDLKVKAALLHKSFFFNKQLVITYDDVVEYDKSALVIQSEDNIVDTSEVVSIIQAIKSKLTGTGQKVFTKSKKFVGTAYDYTIESSNGLIYSIYVKHMLSDRIISRSCIIELKDNCFIIEDDFELVKNGATASDTA